MSEQVEVKVEAVVEAEVTTRVVEHDGEKYTVSVSPLDDVEVLEAYEDGKYASLARAILGSSQWSTYKSKKRTTVELLDFITKLISDGDED